MPRSMLRAFIAVGAIAALTVTAGTAAAQSGNINATATVLQPLTVTGVQDLAFGNVYPGVNKPIAYTDATNGGQFSVAGYGGAQVQVTFTLPTALNGPSGSTLPIDSWTGYYNQSNSATTGGTAVASFSTPTTTTLSGSGGTGNLYMFLGARVVPSNTQTAGAYTSAVTMTVAYTGL